MPTKQSGVSHLVPLLNESRAEELIPKLVCQRLEQLIELEVAAELDAQHDERNDERLRYHNGYQPGVVASKIGETA